MIRPNFPLFGKMFPTFQWREGTGELNASFFHKLFEYFLVNSVQWRSHRRHWGGTCPLGAYLDTHSSAPKCTKMPHFHTKIGQFSVGGATLLTPHLQVFPLYVQILATPLIQ